MALKSFITEELPRRALSPSEYTQRMRDHFIATDHVGWLGSGLEGFAHAEDKMEAEYPSIIWPVNDSHKNSVTPIRR